ncbi:MAG TPA: PrsW family glutamic-type intramembrane protease [Blastocatellia bacterium]|nr:PrsW family glutamic-type intramembrane protease [Blastocatellia bacterium]
MKLRLMVNRGSLAGRQFELDQGWVLLGRNEDCALRFDPREDSMVSGRHAIILVQPEGVFITDQQSTNGTFVNGTRVQHQQLKSGDLVELGWLGPQLQVIVEESPRPQPVPHQPPQFQPQQYQAQPPQHQPPQFHPQPHPPQFQSPPQPPPPGPPVFAAQQQQMAAPSPQFGRGTVGSLGMYHPDRDQGKTARSLGIGLALLVAGGIGLIVLGLTVLELGPVTALLSGVVAFVPAVFYLMILLWLDRYDPEPAWLLAGAFAWGGLFAILVSGIANSIFGAFAGDTLAGVISAPIFEEGTKGLGVLLIALAFRREFDSVVDGIVYAGVVALGFATVENVSYYGRSLNTNGMGGLVVTFFLRGVLSPFAHVLFTSMTGIGCGIARETHNKALRVVSPIAGYVGAMMLHSFWNGIASINGQIFLLMYFVVLVPLFTAFVGVAIYLVRREGRILKEMLAHEVSRGLITPAQLEIVSSLFKRTGWIAGAIGKGQLFATRRQFLRAVTKLGLCHWHAARAAAAQTGTQSFTLIPKFQAEVLMLRDQVR